MTTTPDNTAIVLLVACLAAELQRKSTVSITPLLHDLMNKCKRAAEGENEPLRETIQ
jgi:hypothetical protein